MLSRFFKKKNSEKIILKTSAQAKAEEDPSYDSCPECGYEGNIGTLGIAFGTGKSKLYKCRRCKCEYAI